MTAIDLHEEYSSTGGSVQDLFRRIEQGFYVPRYQREYTWEEDNINQLFEDLVAGTRELSEEEDATTFLGTTILTQLANKKESVIDVRAQPSEVLIVIDGQQRISTLALISIQIIDKLNTLLRKLPKKSPYTDIHNASKTSIKRLRSLYAIELGEDAEPTLKPRIIRAEEDYWTYRGDDSRYTSPVTRYIATYIRTGDINTSYQALKSGDRVRRIVKLIDQWLGAVCDAHISDVADMTIYGQFPIKQSITENRIQEYVLGFTDDNNDVKDIVEKAETDKNQGDYYAVAIYQLLLMTYYLLCHCGVNRLNPKKEEQGFDMFQALNATGTPLTVIETFKPQVMQAEKSAKKDWDTSPSKISMEQVQKLLYATSTNQKKNQRTNELLGTFALCYEGTKLGNRFSDQRRWLTHAYENELDKIDQKRSFLKKLEWTADFFYFAWYMHDPVIPYQIDGLDEHKDRELVSMLIQYLRDANSKLSVPILARFYSQYIDKQSTIDEFVESVKACAAFFTLWRSAKTTSGLDDIYRKYFKGDRMLHVKRHSWKRHHKPVTPQDLKRYFRKVLVNRDIASRSKWIEESKRFLLYTELRTICRFVLFIASHDRISDPANPGLSVKGNTKSCPMLTLECWKAKDYKSLEHVAPQNPIEGNTWDPNIYTKNLIHHVGNLILLPTKLNKSANNSDWPIKYEHYCKVALREKSNEDKKNEADDLSFLCAVAPILNVGESGSWNADMINRRTRQIKKLAWATLNSWLEP